MSARDDAFGRWPGILISLGIPEAALTGKHVDCPVCGRSKKFRFDDKGAGSWICLCGAGDGFKLIQSVLGLDFKAAAVRVEELAGTVTAVPPVVKDVAKRVAALTTVWNGSRSVTDGDPVDKYLRSRGIGSSLMVAGLRYHPGLKYWNSDGEMIGNFPAMLARVQSANGKGATIHRTYLTDDGRKANVESPKKIMAGKPISGGAVRLFPANVTMGIAEGIETALAAQQLFCINTWSVISAVGMESWVPPAQAKTIWVFGDNDASFTGQSAAYSLAKRLRLQGFDVEVRIPETAETDWCDMGGDL